MSNTLVVGVSPVHCVQWSSETWISFGPLTTWSAPSLAVAQRWVDEINARGGSAFVVNSMDGIGNQRVCVDVYRMGHDNR